MCPNFVLPLLLPSAVACGLCRSLGTDVTKQAQTQEDDADSLPPSLSPVGHLLSSDKFKT